MQAFLSANCPHTTHACTCPLPSFTSQTELTLSLVSYIPKQSSTIHPHSPLIWPRFHNTHANRPEPPTLTITNKESSSPIPQSLIHATLPSPQPPTPSRPSQPIDELPFHQNYQRWGSDQNFQFTKRPKLSVYHVTGFGVGKPRVKVGGVMCKKISLFYFSVNNFSFPR